MADIATRVTRDVLMRQIVSEAGALQRSLHPLARFRAGKVEENGGKGKG